MNIPQEFNDIRPFEPEELPQVYDRLLGNDQFCAVLKYLYPKVPVEMIGAKMKMCATNLDFQKTFCYTFLENLLEKASTGCDMDVTEIDMGKRYTFISNHRDIVLDSALLDKLLIDAGCATTCEIAIGDNLLSLPWVKDLVRINKSFIVERSLQPRQMLVASKRLSDYMHFAIAQKNENIWIAQREGRAKDSNDRTQEALLKMMAMGGEGSLTDRLASMHIVPLTISYEYDPCDFLKAAEFQLKRDVLGWRKSAHDDVVSMQTGIMGYKGRIHYHCAPCIDEWLATLDPSQGKQMLLKQIAEHIDREIHRNYMLFAGNYVALDVLNGNNEHHTLYNNIQKETFLKYLERQLAKIDIPGKDNDFLMERLLTMYAYPARNYLEAQ